MGKYKVETDKGTFIVETEDGPPQKSVGGFIENIATSGGKLAGDIYHAVTNPVETATGMVNMARGAAEMLIPSTLPRDTQEHVKHAGAVRDMYVERYGGVDKAFETFYNDPVGFLGDVSNLAGGAGLVAKGAGIAAKAANMTRTAQVAGNVAKVAKTVGAVTDPINIATKAVTVPVKALSRRGGALNPTERAAIDYVRSQGAAVPAGTATGNTFIKVAQAGLEHTPGGSIVADKAKTVLGQQMEGIGRRLAAQADPNAVTPETAAEALKTTLEKNVDNSSAVADANYDRVRKLEADPAHTYDVQTSTKKEPVIDQTTGQPALDLQTGEPIMKDVPVMEQVPLPVDVRTFKKELKPIYDELTKWKWPQAKRNSSAGYQALKAMVEGPDALPASVAELGLGGLKELSREGDGLANHIIPKLEKLIDQRVASADPAVLQDLKVGRKATAAKYETKGVLDRLRDEPVQAFGQTTYKNDAGIEQLRGLAKEAPGEMGKIGRAYIEKILDNATNGDRFDATRSLYKEWKNLGPETKKILFKNPAHIADLDKFFVAVDKLSEQINPSRSASNMTGVAFGGAVLADPFSGIALNVGAYGLTKLLYSPKGVDLLLKGVKAPPGSAAAAHYSKRIALLAGLTDEQRIQRHLESKGKKMLPYEYSNGKPAAQASQ